MAEASRRRCPQYRSRRFRGCPPSRNHARSALRENGWRCTNPSNRTRRKRVAGSANRSLSGHYTSVRLLDLQQRGKCSISSREWRAILTRGPAFELTRPMIEPTIDVFEDLRRLSHLTRGYVGRAVSGAVLLAYGMLKGNPIAIVVAALFLPFMS